MSDTKKEQQGFGRTFMKSNSRRELLKISSGSFLLAGILNVSGTSAYSKTKTAKDDGLTKTMWMAQLMKDLNIRASDSPLHLGRFREPMYYLLDPISWAPNSNQMGKFQAVDVPRGFVTDLTSVPRAFWSLLRPDGTYAYAAIIHDYLYWTQTGSRETADQIIKQSMEDFEIDSGTVNTIYAAIRAGGQTAWDNNSRLKASGEKRVLKQFPPNARTQWDVWKRRADVFAP